MLDEDRIARVARTLYAADGQDSEAWIRIGMEEDTADGERYHEFMEPV